MVWEYDADYLYYDHGPLAKTILGKERVQGIDYAYTLQGWLKGVNSSVTRDSIPSIYDMGQDGISSTGVNPIAQDAFGFTIGYFDKDYLAIGTSQPRFEAAYEGSAFGDSSYLITGSGYIRGLYNGNIRHIVNSNIALDSSTIGYQYEYDQLNRLNSMEAFADFDPDSNIWRASGPISDYKERVTYDANGNIITYFRNGSPLTGNPLGMDSLSYNYTTNTNKLTHVTDAVPAGNYPSDIDNQTSGNYVYDQIGNLIEDKSEKINIYWNTYNKVDSIYIKRDSTALKFLYDPANNRVEKRFYKNAHNPALAVDSMVTYYIRDGQGNVVSVYEKVASDTITWSEVNLYGSSRVGQFRPDTIVYYPGYSLIDSSISNIMPGKKVYELTNHLGNVLATVADYKLAVDTNGGGTDFYRPVVLSAQDYYPFGMLMPGRSFSLDEYRFGFQGQEKNNEIKGFGNSIDYKYRMHDPRLGRFFSVDPLTCDYPWNSPFAFSENRVIDRIELEGLESAPPRIFIAGILWATGSISGKDAWNYAFGKPLAVSTAENIQAYAANELDYSINGGRKIGNAINNNEDPSSIHTNYKFNQYNSGIKLFGNGVEFFGFAMTGIEASFNGAVITTLARAQSIQTMAKQLSNHDARLWYNTQKSKIPSLLDKTLPLENQAKQAFNLRNQFRTEARSMMKDRVEAEYLDLVDPNRTWNDIVMQYKDQGLKGDNLWNTIIKAATKGRKSADEAAGVRRY